MIERIIEFSIRNRFIVILLALVTAAWGIYCVINTPVDAIPDLSENQVIVFTDWMGRSPREIEDQITYPLSVSLQGLAGVKTVRSSSEFNFSMINVIFEDKIDFYFARQRVLEKLTLAGTNLPPGVTPYMAPDATALGQIFWYTVEGDGYDLGRLRAIQDWYVRYQLNSVPGVAQVASVGGFPLEYQIDVDPNKLRAYGVTLGEIYSAVSRSNSSVGGRVIQKGNAEYIVRAVGWITSLKDIENIVVKTNPASGTPVYVSNLGTVARGSEFRRSVLEKDGNEVVGAVVMMRHGENPLAVTKAIKQKIEQLQAGLPPGVRIVPFYDRTRLIHGAIHTLTEILTHEMIIASLAILLILMHFRSAFVICITLPMAVLISFIMMRYFGIASNIMSLSGIAVSIGILVDQAIVMVENATHHLTQHFGKEKITGDIRELVIPACRTVGRPIFFSVMIILLSFIPVFSLTGQEGKTFHPLAFTKSFAMIGVAILSITLVPAMIPTFIKGRLKSEEESWIVRSLIGIYKPVLSWAMNYPKTVNWFFIVLLALGWHLSTKLGREYMPELDEGSILDMPVTVPRASVNQVADDLKARDAVLRQFPEVEQIVGKGGRADTPTDPSPIEMVETIINLRPREFWPKRKLDYKDAERQIAVVWQTLEDRGLLKPAEQAIKKRILDAAAMTAVTRLDGVMRKLAQDRNDEFEKLLGPQLARDFTAELMRRLNENEKVPKNVLDNDLAAIGVKIAPEFGPYLAAAPLQDDVNRLIQKIAEQLAERKLVELNAELFALKHNWLTEGLLQIGDVLGEERSTLFTEMLAFINSRRNELWAAHIKKLNYELMDQAPGALDWYALEEIRKESLNAGLWKGGRELSADEATLMDLRAQLDPPLAKRLLLWRKTKDDVGKEMNTVMQMPGWGNIWTQPIINRINMLATGIRTMLGVKIYGSDPERIYEVAEKVKAELEKVRGAVDVTVEQTHGKGYLEIDIDRQKSARYGVNVGDIQDVIEVALGGKAITMTVEGRERFPVRLRYARAWREDEEQVKNLLVSAGSVGMASGPSGMNGGNASGMNGQPASARTGGEKAVPMQIPLSMVADVRITEGPSMIRSENGMLCSYVYLNVRDRDVMSVVEESQRVLDQTIKPHLPQGMYYAFSGQFEHQIRAKKTLQVVFPAVILLIFVILYLTYNDLMDAVLMMMAVPEALVGGIFFLWLFNINWSVAVWVGFIACFGMATETGIIMLVYLREAIEKRGGLEKIGSLAELRQAVLEGAVHRLRPKLLTEGVAIVALAPMLWASGVGHEVISAMAAPVLGGLLVSDEVVDIFIPVRFYWVRRARWLKLHPQENAGRDATAQAS
jgi:Cu(I)/Ag(I) efflux system membrane protein CusA/SilA